MVQAAAAEAIPLVADPEGDLRIAGTGVTLAAIVEVYIAGGQPEEIARRYPTVQLADIYAVLTYYLRHQEEIDAYLRRRREEAVEAVAGERSELLARKHGGQRLSPDQQERLEFLTDRLRELLPPVSPDDLEVLLRMTKEMEQVRERARERRQRLGVRRLDDRPL